MYYTYILRCDDNSLYTGITTDLERRFKQHQGKVAGGAKYTKSRMPIKYEMAWQSENKSLASKLEYRIKKLSKADKELIINDSGHLHKMVGEIMDLSPYILLDTKVDTM